MLVRFWTEEELRGADKWKADFVRDGGGDNDIVDAVPVSSLVQERTVFIDPQAYAEDKFFYLGLESVEPLTGRVMNPRWVLGGEIKSRSKVFFHGDVLYGRLRPNLNKVFLAAEPFSQGICSGEWYVLQPRTDRILPEVLREVLCSDAVLTIVANLVTGSALPRLQLQDLLDIRVSLPTMVQQRAALELLRRIARAEERHCTKMAQVTKLRARVRSRLTGTAGSERSDVVETVSSSEVGKISGLPERFLKSLGAASLGRNRHHSSAGGAFLNWSR